MDYKNKIMEYEIIHQPEQNLFKTEVDGRTAFVQYRLLGDSLDIIPVSYTHLDVYKRQLINSSADG